ncbi:MAG: DEAD/DEAH box helicase [Chitinophagaceae bacterium]|jgi:RecQ family ATP-dependent DNA helicase|nr:DEAD/DEAH box helicase [Chitinophagaceae bacterium]
MNKTLIDGHLKFIDTLTGNKPTVFVYKGFSVHFFKELNKQLPHIDNLSFLDSKNHIDLEKISSKFVATLVKLGQVKNKKTFLAYEEFLLIPAHSLNQFPVDFKIIQNNFYEFYPNQTSQIFADIEDSINSDIPIEDNELFNRFYSDSREIVGFNCIQYLDYENDFKLLGVDLLNFFDPNNISLPEFKDDFTTANNLIQFKAADNSYYKLKFDLFQNAIPKSVSLFVDENIDHILQDFEELKFLYSILSTSDCEITLYRQRKKYEDYWRPELDSMLKKHWNENALFKKLKIYKNPDTSKDLIEHSQGSVVEHIIQQVELAKQGLLFEDIFLTAPTGAGKSLLFQLPAIYIAENEKLKSVTIVVSPLKALMSDQVTALKVDRKFQNVAFLNSDLTLIERQDILEKTIRGEISVLYMSPELLLSYDIKTFIGERELGLLIIDEAHLVSTWGRDFRIDYWFLGNYIRKLRRGSSIKGFAKNLLKIYRFPVVALTATAVYNGTDDMVFETIGSLNMQNCRIYIGRIKREEISFVHNRFNTSSHELDKNIKTKERIQEFIESGKKSIFYFPWISQIEQIAPALDPSIKPFVRKYHAELSAEERNESLLQFKTGNAKSVLATKAFGMGVDISDIEIVYHHAPSGSLADYVQEIGRLARIPGMKGIAMMDFNPKDLKYTRILFGLSSLKQFQIDLVLKKLNNLYQIKRNRNMLVSIEDFQYIFTKDNNAEQKVKSALLVIEKDLLAKFGYNVLIVRPKSLFSIVFGSVSNQEFEILKQTYGDFINEIQRSTYQRAATTIGRGAVVIREENANKKYVKILLDKIWEKHYPNESFPATKFKFFNKTLLPNVEPLLKLQIHFNHPIDIIRGKFENGIKILERVLYAFVGRYFTKEELMKKLKEQISNETTCKKLADLLTVFYADIDQFGRTGTHQLTTGNFLQVERKGIDSQYKVINTALAQVKSQMMRLFQVSFDGIINTEKQYTGFIPAKTKSAREKIKLAYLLEIFELSTYEISGGELPQLFVRINDPQKINLLSRSKYTNNVVTDVERRHKISVEIMTYFFQNKMTDQKKWDYIEDYFLGNEVETIDVPDETILQEHDTVELIVDLLKVSLQIGSKGTVVHVYPKAKAYEVEFKKKDGSITVETVEPHQISKSI